nr:zinc finger BED domain-containing protein RICESLEEPER 2-like [Ipomoea batatas]
MEEVNPTPNVEIIGLEGMEDDVGKDVGREVEEVEGDCEPYKKKQRKKSSIIWQEMTVVRLENGITTDIWTSNQNIQYMVITAHFVDMDSKLQKRVLNFVEVLPPHTGTCACDAIYKCLQGWGIKEKVWTITVDNASYNDSTLRLLNDSLSFHTTLPLDEIV